MNPCDSIATACYNANTGEFVNAPAHTIPEVWLFLGVTLVVITVVYAVVVGLVKLILALRHG